MPRAYEALPRYDPVTGGRSPRAGSRNGVWKRWAILAGIAVGALLFVASGRANFNMGSNDLLKDTDYEYSDSSPIQAIPISEEGDTQGADIIDVTLPPVSPPKDENLDAPEAIEDEDDTPAPAKKPSPAGGKIPTASKPKPAEQEKPKPGVVQPISQKPASEVAQKPKGPSGPKEDKDPAGTTYCTTAFPGKKLVQYALVIDAGSTGSRIHVYKFNYCSASPMLEYEVFEQIRPGLSFYKDKTPEEAAISLNKLMDVAVETVPKSLQHCTPVAVKATAGLRLLGKSASDAILTEVESHLKAAYPFPLIPTDPVVVMDGKDEGVYAWITANYLLGKIGEGAKATDTLAVMDLGGASTQIVFEPTFKDDSLFTNGDHKYALTFGGRKFTLYQHSYLGYGLMQARRSVHNLVAFSWSFSKPADVWDNLTEKTEISNPCMGLGAKKKVELDPPGRSRASVTMIGGTGGYESCKRVVELVMAKDAICEVQPCSFNGVYQPALLDTFSKGSFLALSYFYDRIRPLFEATVEETTPFTLDLVKEMAQTACGGEAVWKAKYKGNKVALDELADKQEYCLDLTFMHALLGLGYEIGSDRELIIGKQLRDVELGWALGAGLAMLDGHLQCLA